MKPNIKRQTPRLTPHARPVRECLSRIRSGAGLLAGLMALAVAACAPTEAPTPIPESAMRPDPGGTLSPGDEIQVSYPGAAEMNTTTKIQTTGRVSLPVIGEVNASGRSVAGLQSALTSMYADHLQDPQVIVTMVKPAASIYVTGEVLEPGKIPMERSLTALEATMEAGGFTKLANPKQVYVVRNADGKHERYVLNLSAALSGASQQPFYLRPYDVVYVGQSRW